MSLLEGNGAREMKGMDVTGTKEKKRGIKSKVYCNLKGMVALVVVLVIKMCTSLYASFSLGSVVWGVGRKGDSSHP